MPIITLGLSHRTAPIELRESLAIDGTELAATLDRLHALPTIKEVVVLSTCNRFEIYAVCTRVPKGWQAIEGFLQERISGGAADLNTYLYRYAAHSAAEHLMQVACGLDSLILGEPQILGQVGNALAAAQAAGTVGAVLMRLFSGAIRAGKRARAETDISRYTTSTSHAAVLLAAEHVPDLTRANVLVVGAGEMARLAIKALHNRNVRAIGCINRTYARAEAVVRTVNGQVFNWFHLREALCWADVVIAATGAPHTVIHAEEVVEILPQRQARELVFVDIALPRDIEETVDQLAGVHRYDIDDLRATLDANLAQREAARPSVEGIIDEEVGAFVHWSNSRQAVPTIVSMRGKVEAIARAELEHALAQLSDLDARDEEIVRRMVHRLVNKVLHEPTVQLKAAAAASPEAGHEYAEAVRALFDLSPTEFVPETAGVEGGEQRMAPRQPQTETVSRDVQSSPPPVEAVLDCSAPSWPWNGA